jgi:hypothetical protein
MRKVIKVYPRIRFEDTYGFRIVAQVTDIIDLSATVKAPITIDSTRVVTLAEAEKSREIIEDIINTVEKTYEQNKTRIKAILDSINEIASKKGYEIIFAQESDP